MFGDNLLPSGHSSRDDASLEVIRFSLVQDADGWPPVSVESLWAAPLDAERGRLMNIPFFVTGVAAGDVIRTVWREGERWAASIESRSGHYVIRLATFPDARDQAWVSARIDEFEHMGLDCEGSGPPFWMVAVDIPPSADYASIKRHLEDGERRGLWEYEEACVGAAWHDA